MTRTQAKAAATAERGWEGVASGYDTVAEHLAAAVTEQRALSEHLEGAIEVLRQVDEDTSLGDVAGGLTHASCELDRARTACDAVASSLDDARSHLAATGEESLTDHVSDLIDELQESTGTITSIQSDIDDERAAAEDAADGPGTAGGASRGPTPSTTAVHDRIAELRRQGHASQRHGPHVTDQQLTDRALFDTVEEFHAHLKNLWIRFYGGDDPADSLA